MIIHPPKSWLRNKAKARSRWARQATNRGVSSALMSQAQIDQMLAERQATARGLGKELAGKEVADGSAMAKRSGEPRKMTSQLGSKPGTSSSTVPPQQNEYSGTAMKDISHIASVLSEHTETAGDMPNQMTGPAAVTAANPSPDNSPRQLPTSYTSTK